MGLKDLKCSKVKKLKDIQGDGTEDNSTKSQSQDRGKVSCLQTEPINELKDKIKKYYSEYTKNEEFYQAICKFCKKKSDKEFLKKLNGETQWEKLYNYLGNKGFTKKIIKKT